MSNHSLHPVIKRIRLNRFSTITHLVHCLYKKFTKDITYQSKKFYSFKMTVISFHYLFETDIIRIDTQYHHSVFLDL